MKQIPLTRGYVAIVDDADYDRVMAAGPWHARPRRKTAYAQRAIRRPAAARTTTQQLHTFLTGWPLVDHRNGDGLDNRRANLRQATFSQNTANSRVRENSTSGFKGIDYAKRLRLWRARIQVSGKRLTLGHFGTAEAAARAYDAAAVELFGEFACPNFPLETAS